jgi:serine/threonine-protein kinase HipA
LTVGTQGRDATLENALSESNLFGIDPQEAKTIIAKMVRIAKYWRDLYKKCGVSEKDIDYISSAFAAVEH